ncbi:MAG: hypothetical protein CMK44_05520 [Porticoccus sp.]|jgi:hypothetical protein|nr:hypothetical protein [Porticoccus sp.]|tara:strand:+ start:510 stop:1052 length:543 start_codon:yes stop_codon:yes gene_type:complete
MNSDIYIEYIIIAVSIIFILGLYALILHLKIRKQSLQRKNNVDILSKHLVKRQDEFKESIRVIASAIVQDQICLTEGAIRINKLSSHLDSNLSDDIAYEVFSELTKATAHIPILENWIKLTKEEQASFEVERKKIEKDFQHLIKTSAQRILDLNAGKIQLEKKYLSGGTVVKIPAKFIDG